MVAVHPLCPSGRSTSKVLFLSHEPVQHSLDSMYAAYMSSRVWIPCMLPTCPAQFGFLVCCLHVQHSWDSMYAAYMSSRVWIPCMLPLLSSWPSAVQWLFLLLAVNSCQLCFWKQSSHCYIQLAVNWKVDTCIFRQFPGSSIVLFLSLASSLLDHVWCGIMQLLWQHIL